MRKKQFRLGPPAVRILAGSVTGAIVGYGGWWVGFELLLLLLPSHVSQRHAAVPWLSAAMLVLEWLAPLAAGAVSATVAIRHVAHPRDDAFWMAGRIASISGLIAGSGASTIRAVVGYASIAHAPNATYATTRALRWLAYGLPLWALVANAGALLCWLQLGAWQRTCRGARENEGAGAGSNRRP